MTYHSRRPGALTLLHDPIDGPYVVSKGAAIPLIFKLFYVLALLCQLIFNFQAFLLWPDFILFQVAVFKESCRINAICFQGITVSLQ